MKKNYLRGKKATIPFTVLLAMIMIVVSFLVILFFYWQYNWKGEIDKQVCHESVIFKATAPNILDRKVVDLPLRCRTEKICITDKFLGGDCEGFTGEKNINIEKVSKDKEKRIEEIKKIIADSLYDCWWMMGEGRVQAFSRKFEEKGYSSSCVICARIDFDKDLKEELKTDYPTGIPGISKFLDTKEIPVKGKTYSEFLTGFKGERPYGEILQKEDTFGIEQQAIVFQEFDRTTAPEDITGVVAGIATALVAGVITKDIKIAGVSGFLGGYVGRKGGSLIGGLIGEKYIASWAFAPYRVKSEEIETNLIKGIMTNFGEGDKCVGEVSLTGLGLMPSHLDFGLQIRFFAISEEGKFLWSKDGKKFEDVDFNSGTNPDEIKTVRDYLNQVLAELTIKCYNLKTFQCGEFESYV